MWASELKNFANKTSDTNRFWTELEVTEDSRKNRVENRCETVLFSLCGFVCPSVNFKCSKRLKRKKR